MKCAVPWPVCPDCLGEPLSSSGGVAECRLCRERFPVATREPCPDPATVTVTGGGLASRVCRSHGVRAVLLVDATVTGLSAEDRALASTLGQRDRLSEARRRHELLSVILPGPVNEPR